MPQELRIKLKEARAKLGLSQTKFAAMIGVPARTLINWENNQYTPDAFKLALLNEKLDAILAEK